MPIEVLKEQRILVDRDEDGYLRGHRTGAGAPGQPLTRGPSTIGSAWRSRLLGWGHEPYLPRGHVVDAAP
ncbi:hypothetical protein BU204_33550 [Actinophytocola xanthii]|uniref:Uncharacterized protein n=1 Tax=Actinophytocola xanthii TaxID=1912961 RepID=A0A1Q8C3J2_9PSEU|nr:hypothetical protein BU204_33550 [Actinophytocola xanthii]